MPKFLRSRKFVIATAVVGVGALGVGVAGAVGGIGAKPGPNANAGSHPAPQATGSSLPAAASAGSGNAASAPVTTTVATPTPPTPDVAPENVGTPDVGEAPASIPDTALNATEVTFGNTVLNILGTTAPGPERGAAISEAAQSKPGPTLPDQANSHKP